MSVPEPNQVPIGTKYNVRITEFANPSRFWYQRNDFSECLDRLEAEMRRFYDEDDESVIFELLNFKKPVNGHPIAFKCTTNWGYWYRGFVQSQTKPNILLVYYTDYGTSEEVRIQDCRYLAPRFQQLPAQAILARLSGIKPINGEWPSELISYAQGEASKAHFKGDLSATLEGYQITGQGCFASVTIQNGEGTVLNDEMVKRGFADIERPAFVEDNFKLDYTEKIGSVYRQDKRQASRNSAIMISVRSILEERLRIRMQGIKVTQVS